MGITDQPYDASWETISLWAILLVVACYVVAELGSRFVLTKDTSSKDKLAFVWFAFDGVVHGCIELPFMYAIYCTILASSTLAHRTSASARPVVAP